MLLLELGGGRTQPITRHPQLQKRISSCTRGCNRNARIGQGNLRPKPLSVTAVEAPHPGMASTRASDMELRMLRDPNRISFAIAQRRRLQLQLKRTLCFAVPQKDKNASRGWGLPESLLAKSSVSDQLHFWPKCEYCLEFAARAYKLCQECKSPMVCDCNSVCHLVSRNSS